MEQNRQDMAARARESMEKAAYVAVGAPTTAIKALGARVSDLRDTIRTSRRELSDDVASEIDEWITQGEDVIARAMERVRSSDLADQVRSSARTTREAARVGARKASQAANAGLDLIEPEKGLEVITGVGPGYAEQLAKAGVPGVAGFLDRTSDQAGIESLAAETGISVETLESWRAQIDLARVDGIGDDYLLLLHRTDVWTLAQLRDCDAEVLAGRMREVDLPDAPDQKPSAPTISDWAKQARQLLA